MAFPQPRKANHSFLLPGRVIAALGQPAKRGDYYLKRRREELGYDGNH